MKPEIPLPKDPRHQRFADLILAGMAQHEAATKAGFTSRRESAYVTGKRLAKRQDVQAYLRAVQAEAAKGAVLSATEKREFLARIVRTPLMSIDPDAHDLKDGDLIKKFKRATTETGETWEIEKLDPLKAIAEDNRLSGDDPEANSLAEIAEAIARIGAANAGLPTGKM